MGVKLDSLPGPSCVCHETGLGFNVEVVLCPQPVHQPYLGPSSFTSETQKMRSVSKLPLQDAIRNNEAICRSSELGVECSITIERYLYADISGI